MRDFVKDIDFKWINPAEEPYLNDDGSCSWNIDTTNSIINEIDKLRAEKGVPKSEFGGEENDVFYTAYLISDIDKDTASLYIVVDNAVESERDHAEYTIKLNEAETKHVNKLAREFMYENRYVAEIQGGELSVFERFKDDPQLCFTIKNFDKFKQDFNTEKLLETFVRLDEPRDILDHDSSIGKNIWISSQAHEFECQEFERMCEYLHETDGFANVEYAINKTIHEFGTNEAMDKAMAKDAPKRDVVKNAQVADKVSVKDINRTK